MIQKYNHNIERKFYFTNDLINIVSAKTDTHDYAVRAVLTSIVDELRNQILHGNFLRITVSGLGTFSINKGECKKKIKGNFHSGKEYTKEDSMVNLQIRRNFRDRFEELCKLDNIIKFHDKEYNSKMVISIKLKRFNLRKKRFIGNKKYKEYTLADKIEVQNKVAQEFNGRG